MNNSQPVPIVAPDAEVALFVNQAVTRWIASTSPEKVRARFPSAAHVDSLVAGLEKHGIDASEFKARIWARMEGRKYAPPAAVAAEVGSKSKDSRTRGAGKTMRVFIGDSITPIEGTKQSEIMCNTFIALGLQRCYQVCRENNFMVFNRFLIDVNEGELNEKFNVTCQRYFENRTAYYVVTHFNSQEKVRWIERICDALGETVKIEMSAPMDDALRRLREGEEDE